MSNNLKTIIAIAISSILVSPTFAQEKDLKEQKKVDLQK